MYASCLKEWPATTACGGHSVRWGLPGSIGAARSRLRKSLLPWTAQELWKDKRHVPARTQTNLTARDQYRVSLEQAMDTEIDTETLCSFPWTFRFKRESVPPALQAPNLILPDWLRNDGSVELYSWRPAHLVKQVPKLVPSIVD